jgi:hypothetical protein
VAAMLQGGTPLSQIRATLTISPSPRTKRLVAKIPNSRRYQLLRTGVQSV